MPELGRKALLALAAAVLLVVAFLAGRQTAPARVEERVRVETVEVEKQVVVVEEKVRVETVEVVKTVAIARRTEREERKPDGSIIIERTEDTRQESEAEREAVLRRELEAKASAEKRSSETHEHARVVQTTAPRWKAGVTAGTDVSRLLSSPPLVLGGRAAVRVGPLWLGGWAMSNRTAGLSAELQF